MARLLSSSGMGSLVVDVYATPLTFMDMITECAQFIEKARQDQTCSKEDVLDSMENRISLLAGKLAAYPVCTDFAVPVSERY